MKKIILALFIFNTAITYGQDVKIDGKTFQTVKKTELNAEIEYYQLKEKGNVASKSQSYIKRGGEFTKTIFSEAELKKFVSTGKMSSFGTIKEKQLNQKRKITYVIKSDILIIISKKEKTVYFLEINDKRLAERLIGSDKATKSDDNGGPDSDEECPGDCCAGDCLVEWVGSSDGSSGGCIFETQEQRQACVDGFANCLEKCSKSPARDKPGNNIHLYAITLKKQIF